MKKISAENNSNSAEIDINDDLDREITPSEKPRHEEKSVDGGLKTGHQNRVTKGQLATKCIRHYPALKSPLPPHLAGAEKAQGCGGNYIGVKAAASETAMDEEMDNYWFKGGKGKDPNLLALDADMDGYFQAKPAAGEATTGLAGVVTPTV